MSSTPHPAPELAPRALRALLVSLVLWLLAAGVMVLAQSLDQARQGLAPSPLRQAGQMLPYFAPLVLYSTVLALVLDRGSPWLGRPAALALGYLGAIALFMPTNAAIAALWTWWQRGRPPGGWTAELWRQPLANVWIDLMIASGAFAAQAAWATWRERNDREQQWRQAQTDNYRLRLQLLQGQLEPHFLFNALNGVSSLVRADDRTTALAALARISELLRYALRASRVARVSLAEELAFVREYLAVQEMRHGPRLQLDWQVPDHGLEAFACPPLLLQPLVENAVRHGLEAREGTCRLLVRIEPPGPTLRVDIDNPCDAETDLPGHGVGLSATRERLALLYGSAAALHTRRHDGRYAVTLSWPALALDDQPPEPGRGPAGHHVDSPGR